jgi:alanine racemase
MGPTLHSRPDDRAGAILSVDLAALVQNWRNLKRMAGDRCEVGAVVKADAYGLGVEPVVRTLNAAGCTTFYTAHLAEGLAVRMLLGPIPRVVVMHGPNPGTERDFTAANLVPVLSTPVQIKAWQTFAQANDVFMESIIQLDTGMNRLGLTEREFAHLIDDPDGFSGLHPLALMSHLACADLPDHPMNALQRARFESALGVFRSKFPDTKGSFANSAGILLGPAYQYQLARPGIALYGANPVSGAPNPMIPVVRLMGKILQVRCVDQAAPVGYGATYTARDGAKLATVSIGYADGLFRSLSSRGHGYIDGIRVPVAGIISMDMTVFDVSDVPDSSLGRDATVEILGRHQTVDDVAREAGTIGYEVLTSLGRRYHRNYLPAPGVLKHA